MKLFLEDAPDNLIEYLEPRLADVPESVKISGIDFTYNDSPQSRWEQLVLASQGARLYSNNPNPHSPLYAGPLPKNAEEADKVPLELNYSSKQAKYIQSFGVTYIGRTYVNPRNILLLNHKKKVDDRLDKKLPEALEWILRDAPEDWWGTMAVASFGSVQRLEKLLNAMPDVIPMVLAPGIGTQVKFAGFEYVHLNEPKPGPVNWRYGADMRGRSNDLSRKLALEQTGDWVEPENGVYVPDRSPASTYND